MSVPERSSSAPARARSAGAPSAPLHALHQVYRIARQVRAQRVGEPGEVTVPGAGRLSVALIQRTRWVLKFPVQSAVQSLGLRSRYMRMPEARRRKYMQRHDDFIQVWWASRDIVGARPRALTKRLVVTRRPHAQHRELVYLGRDSRFVWYVYAPIQDWVRVQRALSLGGGQDPAAALIRGLGVRDRHDATAVGCFYLLSDMGARALGAVEAAIANKHPQRGQAIRAVGRDRGKAVTSWLMRLVSSPDPVVGKAARSALLHPPRQSAAALYVKWLAAGAGRRGVERELDACAAVKARGAVAVLPRVLASPQRFREYRKAFLLGRVLAGREIDRLLLDAERQVMRAGLSSGSRQPDRAAIAAGIKTILGSADGEAAGVIGLSLALYVSKGDYQATNKAGVEILRKISGDQGLLLVMHLAKALRDLGDQGAVRRIAAALRAR